mgnify:CR=1 FL=1
MADTTPTAIFDLDGSLAHTGPDLVAALNHAIATLDLPPVALDQMNVFLGQGAVPMIERALDHFGVVVNDSERQNLLDRFLQYYQDTMPGETRLFDGVEALMNEMESHGWLLCICTNKRQDMADRLLDRMGLSARFSAICGGDAFEFKKPDGRHLIETVKKAGGSPSNAVMFGDSIADVNGAKDARIPVVGVTFGYTNTPMAQLGPDMMIDSFRDLSLDILGSLVDR